MNPNTILAIVIAILIGTITLSGLGWWGFYLYELGFKRGVDLGMLRKEQEHVMDLVYLDDLKYLQDKLDRTSDPVQRARLEKMVALFEDAMLISRATASAFAVPKFDAK